jgi:hypothetical protein
LNGHHHRHRHYFPFLPLLLFTGVKLGSKATQGAAGAAINNIGMASPNAGGGCCK